MAFVQELLAGHTFDERPFPWVADPRFEVNKPKTVTLGNYIYVYLGARFYDGPEWTFMNDNLGNTYNLLVSATMGTAYEQRLFVAEVTVPGAPKRLRGRLSRSGKPPTQRAPT